uniref:Uncharacterized protein n=1 Tax=Arundo donax TaxID=35708 RepID=A0A0A9AW41_ARUDO
MVSVYDPQVTEEQVARFSGTSP